MSEKTPTAERLTIAFVTIGATQAWKELSERTRQALIDHYSGFLGVVDHVIAAADLLDERWDKLEALDQAPAVVFVYEIAEVFGEKFLKAISVDSTASPMAIVDELMPLPTPPAKLAVVVAGDLMDGVTTVYGPFENNDVASEWGGERDDRIGDYIVIELTPPT